MVTEVREGTWANDGAKVESGEVREVHSEATEEHFHRARSESSKAIEADALFAPSRRWIPEC
jgi:hypothetical protein